MSEIRSTIDIMMERTRGMLLSDQEKQRLKEEEQVKKAKGYALKLLDPAGPNESGLSSLLNEAPEERAILENLVWKEIVSGISNEAQMTLFLDRFGEWPFANSRKTKIEEFRKTFQNQAKDKNKDKKTILEREKKKLADAGISGSAVVPKFMKDMESSSLQDLIQQFRKTLLAS